MGQTADKRLKRLGWSLLLLALLLAGLLLRKHGGSSSKTGPATELERMAEELAALKHREEAVAKRNFGPELLAQEYGRVAENLWDGVNSAANKLSVLGALKAQRVLVPAFNQAHPLQHGITAFRSSSEKPATGLQELVGEAVAGGWVLVQGEIRHNRFEPAAGTTPPKSEFSLAAHLVNQAGTEEVRAILEGNVRVIWGNPGQFREVDARNLTLKTRSGTVPFRPVIQAEVSPPEGSFFVDPLLLYDLDHDGSEEIILAAANLVFERLKDGTFKKRPLLDDPGGFLFTALLADFTKDGLADFLCARFEGLYLYEGKPNGAFAAAGRLVWKANPRLKYGQVLTCGDIDGDNDLDLFLGQYKVPYEKGQMPTPYFDANDGNPSFLLENEGPGQFNDVTASSGLGQKRWRRVYSSSFADLDLDGDLDLAVVSDFAGLDVFANDGQGKFRDVTPQWFGETRAFGMSHLVHDFNLDGALDFLLVGMNSPAADRLNALGLLRPGADDLRARRELSFGNRLFFGAENANGKRFAQNSQADQALARSGWAWGAAACDLDNDGWPDLYFTNGHVSGDSVKDYDAEFWLHDVYAATSAENPVTMAYFREKLQNTRGRGWSYGGYDMNRLYLNQGGTNLTETAFLFGLAFQEDCRNVLAHDLDHDGRQDLVLTTFQTWPVLKQTVRIFRNELESTGDWIGFRLAKPLEASSSGATLRVVTDQGETIRQFLTGEGYRSQSPAAVHLGLGKGSKVQTMRVDWRDGKQTTLSNPAGNQSHLLKPAD